jgi:CubicO group peptidase (beta-lactamase class C family)
VCIDAARANVLTSEGEYGWGGLAKTYFFIDPEEELIGIFMTQIFADGPLPTDRAFRTGVYQAIID